MSDTEIDTARVLCRLADLLATGCRDFRLGGGDWPLKGFVVNSTSGPRAYVNRCAHLSYPLNYLPDRYLTPDGALILCQAHGALFDKGTGLCIAGPCAGRSLIALEVRVVGEWVLLSEGQDIEALAERYA